MAKDRHQYYKYSSWLYQNTTPSYKTLHHIEIDIANIKNRSCEVPNFRNATNNLDGRDTWKTHIANTKLAWIYDIIKDT